jgi:hypothetical protein
LARKTLLSSLSGTTVGINPGVQMTLQGKKIEADGSNALAWETKKITQDFGVCQP